MEEQLTPLLKQLAENLGTTTEYLWGVLIKQAHIQIYTFAFSFVIYVTFAIGFYKFVKWYKTNLTNMNEHMNEQFSTMSFMAITIYGIFMLFSGISIMNDAIYTITAILNPEGWALQEIFRLLGK